MKCLSIIMVSLLLVAIALVSSNETGLNEQSLNQTNCHYEKSQWSPCDEKTNVKVRTLTLKKGDDTCMKVKTIEKKCKKACRYVKGTWSQCNSHNEMIRTDTLKDPSTENSNCEKTRQITKKCKSKGRGNKANTQQTYITKQKKNKKTKIQINFCLVISSSSSSVVCVIVQTSSITFTPSSLSHSTSMISL
ncbi:hypothetical protein AGLY_014750 [Aphis glycines]|uniref:Pleiotrophin/Midkine C-terminal domain-containing protein n=1 Tax=Aphis glycines TaxID=307491 RepID=A0A6G0T225_APHGL|nr:hypothetical protein AGLY_014750 [Aphis glycines]